MKKVKKLIALLITVAMVLSNAVIVSAAQSSNNTITVNNAKPGESYAAYKMLELFVNDTESPSAYAYTAAADWTDFFADANAAVWGTVLEKDSTGTYFQAKEGVESETAWSSSSALSAFAEAAAKYAADRDLTAADKKTCAEDAASVVLSTTESGYYLVTSTLGTRAMIDTTPGNVSINEKNEEDTIEKTVKEDSTGTYGESNDAQVGDTVEFKSKVRIVPRSINVKIHDKMDEGLTLNVDSIKVYTDEACSSQYTGAVIRTGEDAGSGDTFTIDIPDSFAAEADAAQYLYVVYTAELNRNAVVKDENGVEIVDQNNKTKVSFGNGTTSEEDTTTTSAHKFAVKKYADQITNLADAIFRVKKNGTALSMVKLDDNNYRIVDDTETVAAVSHVKAGQEVNTIAAGTIVSDFVTVSTGNIVIWGVDSDSDYSIEELQAPKGYNMINPAEVSVTVNADNSTVIEVENKTGVELPSTGGSGTTLFYAAGAVLLIGAGVIWVIRRRENSK